MTETDKDNECRAAEECDLFAGITLPIPENVNYLRIEEKRLVRDYLLAIQEGSDDIYRKGYCLAFRELGSSFDVVLSNGFLAFMKNGGKLATPPKKKK